MNRALAPNETTVAINNEKAEPTTHATQFAIRVVEALVGTQANDLPVAQTEQGGHTSLALIGYNLLQSITTKHLPVHFATEPLSGILANNQTERTEMSARLVTLFLLISTQLVFVSTTSLFAQAQDKDGKDKPISPFGSLNAQVLRIKFDGQDLAYSKSVLVGINGKDPVVVNEKIQQTYTVLVPYTEKVDGKTVTKYRSEERTRTVNVTKVIEGEYKTVTKQIDKNIEFFDRNGDKLDRKQAINKIGMNEAHVLILPENQEIPAIWSKILNKDVLVVRSNQLLTESFQRNRR